MICLDDTDTLEGGASVDNVVDYSVYGLAAPGVFKRIAIGKLSSTDPTVLYTCATATGASIVAVIYVNNHTSAVTVNLYVDPLNAGTPIKQIPKNLSLGSGYRMGTDGVKFFVEDTNGAIVTTGSVSDEAYDESTWNGVTAIAPSKNAVRDEFENRISKTLFDAQTILAAVTDDTPAAVAIAVQQVVGRLTGGNIKGLSATELTALLNAATTSLQGAVELATVAEAVAGTDTSRATTAQGVAAAIAVNANPKAFAQAVNMTAAASGSNGIQVAHDAKYANTTNSFGITLKRALPLWTPSANVILKQKLTGGAGVQVEIVATTGVIRLTLNATVYNSSVPGGGAASNLVAGTEHQIDIDVSVGASTTTVSFYVDGYLLSSPAAQANVDLTNTAVLYIMGTSAVRTAGVTKDTLVWNWARTAAEVLDLYRKGIPESWKWGSQTSLITGNNSTFAGASDWANYGFSTYDETTGGVLTVASNAAGQACRLAAAYAPTVIGKRYRLTFDMVYTSGNFTIQDYLRTTTIVTSNATGTVSAEFTATSDGGIYLTAATGSSATFDNFLLHQIGVTLALESEGIQPSPGQWLDSSSNKLHALMPAAGATITRQKIDPCWMMFDTGTVDQFIHFLTTGGAAPGTTRVIFPAGNYLIDEIWAYSAGTPTFNLGDDAATPDTLVASVTLVAATWTKLTLLKYVTDHSDIFVDFTAGGAVTKFKVKYHLIETY